MKVLRPYAVLSSMSRGREHEEAVSDGRLCFQRDRDRIIHCRAFRRLKAKTQVFVPNYGDHYRNRLTHSLEVAQVSSGMARSLGLNEDLVEAIALAHDLGHTPFGHAGEEALNECLHEHGMHFEHNEQSKRIVTEIEHVYPGFRGLNLSIEVLEGMMKHETFWDKPRDGASGASAGVRPSLEAQIVNFGDEIAYQNHDVDDGLRAGLISEKDLAELGLWKWACEEARAQYGSIEDEHVWRARVVSKMIGLMMSDIISESVKRLEGIVSLNDVYESENKLVGFSEEMLDMNKKLKDFLLTKMYLHPTVVENSEKGQAKIRQLFTHYIKSMEPAEVRDYLAGMTDDFALAAL